MNSTKVRNGYVVFHKIKGEPQHILIFSAPEKDVIFFLILKNPVCIINADFTAGIDAVLTFPKLNQPGLSLIVKIYRKAVKDHVETKGCLVIEGAIPESSLPGVYPGGEEILGRNVRIAERSNELIQQISFFEHAHGTDLFDDSFSAPKIEAEEEKKKEQK